MPFDRIEWPRRLKAIEREYQAARVAVAYYDERVRVDPTLLEGSLGIRDIANTAAKLEGTYVIRLFAEFETALREFWPTRRSSKLPSQARNLIDGVASACKIASEQLQFVHDVREFRNGLVHERGEVIQRLQLRARAVICVAS